MSAPERFERLEATRIVAAPGALDEIDSPDGGRLLRLAPDDLLVLPPPERVEVADPYAIIEPEAGFSAAWFDRSELARLQAVSGWEFPVRCPEFAQGHLAGVPVKMLFDEGGVLVLVPAVLAHHLEERLGLGERAE
ncbi:MAG: hypothetical protein F4X74_08870 [Acidimicrobiia bacterium]|nr:hypothetical protein [Acidimicrobiia bacterium]